MKGIYDLHNSGTDPNGKPLPMAHLDLKIFNVLLSSEFDLKIADFGFGMVLNGQRCTDRIGTPGYMAPEIFALPNSFGQQEKGYDP